MECVKYGKIRKCCAEQTSGSGEGRIQRQGISEGFSSCDLQKSRCDYGSAIFLFESKVALFEEIVEETVEDLKRIMGDFTDQEKQLHPEEYDRILMEFIWENRDIAKILIDGAEGTRYVNFREDACTKMEQILNERFQKECGQEVDHELVHILVQMKFQGYCELLRGNCSREKLLEISRILQICSSQCLLAIEAELNRKH